MVFILSIDIGIINLGYVYADVTINDEDYNKLFSYSVNKESIKNHIEIIKCDKIDITNVKHHKVNFCDCKLLHERCVPDYLDHFVQEHQELFDNADIVILERQPPVGITNVQDLLFKEFRSKVKMISPNSVHKYFLLSSDYNIRKEQSEKISNEYLQNFSRFSNNIRKHDMSDALLMIIYYYKIQIDSIIKKKEIKKTGALFEDFIFLQK